MTKVSVISILIIAAALAQSPTNTRSQGILKQRTKNASAMSQPILVRLAVRGCQGANGTG